MKNVFKVKRINISHSTIFLLLISVFFVTKMLRAFSGSTQVGGIWVYIQIFIVFVGMLLIIKKYKIAFSNGAIISLLLYTVISMLNSLFSIEFTVKSVFSYIMIPYALCVLMIFLVDGYNRNIESNLIISITFYVISVIFIYSMLSSGSYSTAVGAVSDSYYVIGLLPIMLIYNRNRPFIPILFAGLVIMISGKRAGLIAFALMVILYFAIESLRTKRHKDFIISFFSLLFIVIIIYVAFVIINQSFNTRLLTKLLRLYQDGGSGRSDRWQYILKEYSSSSAFEMIFGHGDAAVSDLLIGHAHNDFIELLYNYGIFSVLCYIAFYIYLIIEFINMIKSKYEYSAQFLMSIIFSFVIAFFSYYVIDPTYITSGMICIGYIMSDYRKKKKIQLLERIEIEDTI